MFISRVHGILKLPNKPESIEDQKDFFYEGMTSENHSRQHSSRFDDLHQKNLKTGWLTTDVQEPLQLRLRRQRCTYGTPEHRIASDRHHNRKAKFRDFSLLLKI